VDGQFVKPVVAEFAGVFALEPQQFFVIEPRVVPEDLRQIETLDDFVTRQFFAVVLGDQPSRQR